MLLKEDANMFKYSLLIVDDNKKDREMISKKILEIFPDKFNMVLVDDVNAMKYIENSIYDGYLLDIEMPIYDGFALASKIQNINCNSLILFLTSHEDYSLKGYEYNIFRFISKFKLGSMLPNALSDILDELQKRETYIEVKDKDNTIFQLLTNSIHYVSTSGNNLRVCTGNKEFMMQSSLCDFSTRFKEFPFAEPRKGFLVNLNYIECIDFDKDMIHMKSGRKISISRRKRKTFYMRYSLGL